MQSKYASLILFCAETESTVGGIASLTPDEQLVARELDDAIKTHNPGEALDATVTSAMGGMNPSTIVEAIAQDEGVPPELVAMQADALVDEAIAGSVEGEPEDADED